MLRQARYLTKAAIQRAFPQVAFRLMQVNHAYDENELDLLPVIVDQAREAIDVGANVGRYAAPLAKLARHVHAFEPHPRLVRVLKSSLPSNVTVQHAAVSNAPGWIDLNIPVVGGRELEGVATVEDRLASSEHKKVRVPTITLDELSGHDIGFIKIDVEGHEVNVLRGAQKLIPERRPTVLVEVEERHRAGSVHQVFSFFAERNYEGTFVYRGKILDIGQFSWDMQDPKVLSQHEDKMPRRLIPYVNNFLFIQRERWSPELMAQAESRLRRHPTDNVV